MEHSPILPAHFDYRKTCCIQQAITLSGEYHQSTWPTKEDVEMSPWDTVAIWIVKKK